MTRPSVTLMTQIFPPESNAGANRTGAAAEALAAVSDLRVVTTLPSYPTPEFHKERHTLAGHDEPRPYRVERTAHFHPHRGSFVIRALRELAMAGRLAWRAFRHPGDVLVATSPSIFVALTASVVSVVRRVPLVIDLRDLTWEYVSDDAPNPLQPLRVLARLLRSATRPALRRASLVAVANDGIGRAVEDLGVAGERIIATPNGISTEILDKAFALDFPAGDPPGFVVTYAGALGYYQGIATLLEVAALMPEVEFRIVGEGPERAALVDTAVTEGLENVSLPGYVSLETLLKTYGESDILFAQLRHLAVLETAMIPAKIYEFMATGRPVVYAGRGLAAELLQETGSALIADPEDAGSIRDCIQRLIDDPQLRRELAANGRAGAPAHRRENIMEGLAERVIALAER